MATDRIVGIDLGTTNSLVAFMQGETPVTVPGGDSTIEQRIKILEVETRLDGEPASWEQRYPIERDIEDECIKLKREINRCHEGDRADGLRERLHDLGKQLEKAKRL